MLRGNQLEETARISARIIRIIYTFNKKTPSEFSLFKKIDIIKPKTIQNEKTFISYIFTV